MDPTSNCPDQSRRPLRGRGLRFVLVDELMSRRSMTVAEMVTVMAGHGFNIEGRASKAISDALRWEVRRGRVVRLHFARLCIERIPRERVSSERSGDALKLGDHLLGCDAACGLRPHSLIDRSPGVAIF